MQILFQQMQLVKPATEEPPQTSNELKSLWNKIETRRWLVESELELIELLREQEDELNFIEFALKQKGEWILGELCLDVERYGGSHSGIWFLDMLNDPDYFMELHPDAPDYRKYRFGSYWTRDEGQAIPFIKDRMKWAQGIVKRQLPLIDELITLVQNWDFNSDVRERYMEIVEQIDLYVPTPPFF